MSSPTSTAPPFRVSEFMGPYLVEMCVALVLYGITTAQTYVYMLNYKTDVITLKTTVAAVWIIETIHTVFLFRQVWFCAIMGFGDYNAIGSIEWSIIVSFPR
ncbi:hypothetical protein QCA50_007757 [Cerrena zonata]|uniref:Uncharacterized protein n=1 Tax=Cerrena zonata TaxID=2478898 RepID=A0AAW0G8K1_9APHY